MKKITQYIDNKSERRNVSHLIQSKYVSKLQTHVSSYRDFDHWRCNVYSLSLQRRYLRLIVARSKNKHTSTNGSKRSIPYEIRVLSVAIRYPDSFTYQFEPPSWQSNLSDHNRRSSWAKLRFCEISWFLLHLRNRRCTFLCPLFRRNIVRGQHSNIWVNWELYCFLNSKLELPQRSQRQEMLTTYIYSYFFVRHSHRFNHWNIDWLTWTFRWTFYWHIVWIVCYASAWRIAASNAKF